MLPTNGATPPAPPPVGPVTVTPMDLKLVGNIEKYRGNQEVFPQWRYGLLAAVGSWNREITQRMMLAEQQNQPIPLSSMGPEAQAESHSLSFVLSQVLKDTPLITVMNLEPGYGYEAWRVVSRQAEPRTGFIVVGLFMSVLKMKLGPKLEELQRQLEDYEQMVTRYENASGEIMADSIQQAIVKLALPREMEAIVFREFTNYQALKEAILQCINVRQVTAISLSEPTPATVKAMTAVDSHWLAGKRKKSKGKGKDKGKTKDKDKPSSASVSKDKWAIQCHWCLCWGHRQKDCLAKKQYDAQIAEWENMQGDQSESGDVRMAAALTRVEEGDKVDDEESPWFL